MGLNGSPTTALYFDAVPLADHQRIGDEGQGAKIALSSLDSGRLGIAACATGLAQAAWTWRRICDHAGAVRASDCGVPGAWLPARGHGGSR